MVVNLKILSVTCLAGAVVASWSLTQKVAGSNKISNKSFVTEFTENNSRKLKYLISVQL